MCLDVERFIYENVLIYTGWFVKDTNSTCQNFISEFSITGHVFNKKKFLKVMYFVF